MYFFWRCEKVVDDNGKVKGKGDEGEYVKAEKVAEAWVHDHVVLVQGGGK